MKQQHFIRSGRNIYVPPTKSWLEGWTRQRWLEKYFKDPERILVTSKMSWDYLSTLHEINILCEKSGQFMETKNG